MGERLGSSEILFKKMSEAKKSLSKPLIVMALVLSELESIE